MDSTIELAEKKDLAEILQLQKLCYQKEANRYNDYSIPPLIQTLEEIEAEFPITTFLKLMHGAKIIGSIKGKISGSTCEIGRLMVHPDYQRQGLGKSLIQEIEKIIRQQSANKVERFELFTGEQSFDNIALYEEQGYRIYKTEPFDKAKNIVYMEKRTLLADKH